MVAIITGFISKSREKAPPILDIISKDKANEIPIKIFLPKVTLLFDPKINNIPIIIMAIRVNGLISLL